jgi:hypothetical protein
MKGRMAGSAWGALVGAVCALLVLGLDLAIPFGSPLSDVPLLISFVAP